MVGKPGCSGLLLSGKKLQGCKPQDQSHIAGLRHTGKQKVIHDQHKGVAAYCTQRLVAREATMRCEGGVEKHRFCFLFRVLMNWRLAT
jgi:hypothetical protein